ncbi:hypothetical protein ACQWTT_001130 [Acinetobacter baumannii]
MVYLPTRIEENNQYFSDYLGEMISNWETASLDEKDYQLHDFLNIECGAGVFTHQINEIEIRIEYDSSTQITINTNQPLNVINLQLNSFLMALNSK